MRLRIKARNVGEQRTKARRISWYRIFIYKDQSNGLRLSEHLANESKGINPSDEDVFLGHVDSHIVGDVLTAQEPVQLTF